MNTKHKITVAKLSVILGLSFVLICSAFAEDPKEVTFRTKDGLTVTADLYAPNPATAPFILLFHQANYSRGEYVEIAPELNKLGFNCLAVDLRSGGEARGVRNETFHLADSLGKETRYIDVYPDMWAAIAWKKKNYPNAKLLLWGSSYSASLVIKVAAESSDGVSGVLAFSPGEYFSKFGTAKNYTELSAKKLTCAVFITSKGSEEDQWINIYNSIPSTKKVKFLPEGSGMHGAKALWPLFPDHEEYWAAVKKFLVQFK